MLLCEMLSTGSQTSREAWRNIFHYSFEAFESFGWQNSIWEWCICVLDSPAFRYIFENLYITFAHLVDNMFVRRYSMKIWDWRKQSERKRKKKKTNEKCMFHWEFHLNHIECFYVLVSSDCKLNVMMQKNTKKYIETFRVASYNISLKYESIVWYNDWRKYNAIDNT